MPIQTGGFQVGVLPQPIAIDPRLYAVNPQALTTGALQGINVVSELDKLKAERAQQAELAATRDARIAQIQALSNLDVLQSQEASALAPRQTKAKGLQLDESIRQGEGLAGSFGVRTALESQKRTLEGLQVGDQLKNVKTDAAIERRVKTSTALMQEAHAAAYLSELESNKAKALAAGIKLSPEDDAYLKGVGSLAGDLLIPPAKIIDLVTSKAQNERGESLAVEFAKFAQDVKKPEFAKNPFAGTSESLKSWLAGSPETIHAIESQIKSAPADTVPAIERVIVHPNGKVERVKSATVKEAPVSSAAPRPQVDPAVANGVAEEASKEVGQPVDTSAIADTMAVLAPVLSGIKGKQLPQAIKVAGKLAGLKLASNALGVAGAGARAVVGPMLSGASYAVAPASVAYGLSGMAGKAMSNSMLGNMQPVVGDRPKNLSEAVVLGLNQPSTEAMAQETRYDDVSHRIQSLMRSYNPDDPKQLTDLTNLLNERNLLWSMLQGGESRFNQ